MPEVYALNHNYGTYQIEHDLQMSTSYTLYNRDAVARLLRENPDLLPQPRVDVPKDKRWNRRHLQTAVTQGILTGESMQKIADRFQNVAAMDERAAMRNARTAVTGAENAGKLDSMRRARDLGVNLKKLWLATRDQRTRDSHVILDGELREIEEPFSNGLMYPGDPEGAPGEVYNCRCAMRSKVAGADPYSPDLSRNERLGGMSYEEWKRAAGERFYSKLFGEKAVPKYTGDDFIDGKQFDRSKIHYSSGGKSLQRRLDRAGIEYREVQALPAPLSDDEIINRVGGRDMTDGSCFPLACAYIGNKHGLDVLDFRGGDSLELFRDGFTNITHLNGITEKYSHKSDANQLMKMIGMMEDGKEYMLTGGNHTSIVRLNKGVPEYLTLHRDQNGWFPFEEDKILKDGSKRHQSLEEGIKIIFHCYGKLVDESSLIDIDQFKNSDEFRDLLGYINTEENRQRKKR